MGDNLSTQNLVVNWDVNTASVGVVLKIIEVQSSNIIIFTLDFQDSMWKLQGSSTYCLYFLKKREGRSLTALPQIECPFSIWLYSCFFGPCNLFSSSKYSIGTIVWSSLATFFTFLAACFNNSQTGKHDKTFCHILILNSDGKGRLVELHCIQRWLLRSIHLKIAKPST